MRALSSLYIRFRKLPHTLQASVVFAVLLGLMFGDVLTSQARLLSLPGTDLALQFSHWRTIGFAQIKAGSVPLWNPYLFSGTPFQASFQTAFFYPVNWVHLVLPSVLALNWEIVVNIFLAGLGMYVWARRSGTSFVAAVLAGALLMFGMPFFLRISGGHLAPLGAMAWIPWIFASVDALFERVTSRALLRGIGVCALQLLAGHPQTSFTTMIAVGLYCVLRLIFASRAEKSSTSVGARVARCCVGLFAFALGGFALSSIQLVPSLAVTSETLRSRVSYEFASSFSFPPENFSTWIAPSFFGDIAHLDYWGRCYLWEMSLFFGIGGLVFALCGLFASNPRKWTMLGTLVLLLVLALGGHTPILRFLYDNVPGFDRLRSHSKFSVPAAVLLCLLGAHGYDFLKSRAAQVENIIFLRRLCCGLAVAAALLAGSALFVFQVPDLWHQGLAFVAQTQESYAAPARYADSAFAIKTAQWAAQTLGIAAFSFALFALLLWNLRRRPRAFPAIAALAVLEVFVHAAFVRASFPVADWYPKAEEEFAKSHLADNRILDTTFNNSWMSIGKYSAWGYDPFILRRYAEVMAATQGTPADQASYSLKINRYHPLMKMLRCEAVAMEQNGFVNYGELPPALPHLVLVSKFRVLPNRDKILAAMMDKKFDPAREMILEQKPGIAPPREENIATGTVRLVSQTTDSLEIEADVPTPQILLITDSYSKGWRVQSLEGSSQQSYQLLPANWTLRAVPLQAGRHHFRVVYDPPSWRIGRWISALSLLLYCAAWLWLWNREKRERSTVEFDGTV